MAESPDPLDFLDLDRLLADEERAIRDTVRDCVRERVLPGIEDWFERGDVPAGGRQRSSARSGCSACTSRATAAPGSNAVGLRPGVPGARGRRQRAPLVRLACRARSRCSPIWTLGSEEQKEAWLPAHGRRRGDRLLRPDRARLGHRPGRDADARASRDGDDWVLNGTKMWITNGGVADVAIVWARTDDGDPRLPRPDRHGRASSRQRHPPASSRCARRSRASSSSTTCGCPPTRCCPGSTG